MPRPIRTRVTSSRLAARESQSATSGVESAPKQKPPSDSSTDIYGVSDRELLRREQATTQNAQENPPIQNREGTASSDIYGVSDRELKRRASTRIASANQASRLKATANSQQATALQNLRRRRDAAMGRLENITSTTSTGAGQSSDQVESPPVETGRRMQATTRQRRAPDVSGMDVMDDDEMFGDMDTSFGEQDDSPPPAHSTDTSSFNVGLFQRGRSRQSSIVGKDDAPIRPSSRGPNTSGVSSTFNLGMFKRRAREPSILGTARKPLAQRPDPQSSSGSEQDEAEEQLAPEAESTPAKSRKRKSDEGHRGLSSKRLAADSEYDDIRGSIEVSTSPAQSRPTTPAADEGILAPPASSDDSDVSPSMWPSLKSLAHGHRGRRPASRSQKTPALEDNVSEVSSPPSLTHSPNYVAPTVAKGRGRGTHCDPTLVTTADLAAMLPRRRKKARDDPWEVDSDEDIDTSALGNEADELSYGHSRRAKSTRPLGPSNSSAAQGSRTRSNKPARRTYGSRSFSDKENQGGEGYSIEVAGEASSPLPDDTFDSPEGDEETTLNLGEELKNAVKKFKEVDKWELEFEEVTQSSSPGDAR